MGHQMLLPPIRAMAGRAGKPAIRACADQRCEGPPGAPAPQARPVLTAALVM